MVPISSVFTLRKEKVDRKKFSFGDLQPITIHFGGSIDRREVDQGRDYSMDLFFAHPGDIVVAKIDLKNGAVGLVPDWKNVVVTNHFAIYEPNRSRLVPEYFLRLIQTSFFKAYLWHNKVGAEGRKEVKLEFFENIEIPLPTLDVQRAIIAFWQDAQESAREAEEQVKQIEANSETRFLADFGLKTPKLAQKPRVFVGYFRNFERWSVSYSQARLSGVDIEHAKYPIVELGNILSMVQYGTSEKANIEQNGTPVIRMNNIVDGVLDLSKLKHIFSIGRIAKNW
jgi:type I restriction enzyme S subunit